MPIYILLLTASGPIVILTSFTSPLHPALLEKLHGKGICKFIAFALPLEHVRWRYGKHYPRGGGRPGADR